MNRVMDMFEHYDGGIHQEPPYDEDYETDWDSEEFFNFIGAKEPD